MMASPQAFPQTRWSLVLAAGRDGRQSADALETICRAYWMPLYAYARRRSQSEHDAQDLTQDFFRHLVEHRWLEMADHARGRLRTFLITAFKRHMAKEWRHATAQRRGGAQVAVPIDTAFAESRCAADSQASKLAADEIYDREWALTLLDRTLRRLRDDYAATGREEDFETLKGSLTAGRGALDYAATAARLGATEGAARVSVHRLRKRFREIYRDEIAQTLPTDADVEGEMRHLASALTRE